MSVTRPRKLRNAEILADVMPEDLVKFGLIPEFIGRLPVISILEKLTRPQLVCVLERPNSLLKQYRKMFLLEAGFASPEAITEIRTSPYENRVGVPSWSR